MVPLKFAHNSDEILSGRNIAVVGPSGSRGRGHEICEALKQAGYSVYAVDPDVDEVEGDSVYPHLDNVPAALDSVVTAVSPELTYEVVRQAGRLSIPHVWMEPGSESVSAIIATQALGIGAVYGGPSIMSEAVRYRVERPAHARRNGNRSAGAAGPNV